MASDEAIMLTWVLLQTHGYKRNRGRGFWSQNRLVRWRNDLKTMHDDQLFGHLFSFLGQAGDRVMPGPSRLKKFPSKIGPFEYQLCFDLMRIFWEMPKDERFFEMKQHGRISTVRLVLNEIISTYERSDELSTT